MEQLHKVAVIDDEADGRNIICLLLEQHFPDLRLCGVAENVAQGTALIRSVQPDLIFLDVEMPDGTAFDLLASCKDLSPHVILVTAYDHYALQAIKISVLDYLLKPVNRDEFVAAVRKTIGRGQGDSREAMFGLLTQFQRQLNIRKVRIPTLSGFSVVNVDDIVRCEASGNYTILSFTDHSSIVASRPLGDYESELKAYGFLRIHHKHLINPNQVVEYQKGKSGGGYVILRGREMLEVSARRKAALLQAFGA
ncbi:LytR/AlgR family response regulator transcription factor [Taibaiella koreensis]|uniref:LytR/AlgR family response regulator transcription factor n=1 Tax=Taibaiella koreensis TaxID=1268548 RepID=UPI000E59DCA5|nr:LytTR family DNA-binding domain-containing protein [Taibaiella koreensis]